MNTPVIALLTDFGLDDPYVGQMKGVLAALAPRARVVDLSHGVEPYHVAQAGFFARASALHFPAGTVFVCVVDPGVGSERRVVLLAWRERFFLAPNNGLLSLLLAEPTVPVGLSSSPDAAAMVASTGRVTAFDVTPPAPPASATFHGRDLFAPLAARLANGEEPPALGWEIDPAGLAQAMWAAPREEDGRIVASVLHADRFGNLVLNLAVDAWAERLPVGVRLSAQAGAGRAVGFGTGGPSRLRARRVTHYAQLAPGELGLLAGSQGYLELAMNRASARETLALGPESHVLLKMMEKGG